MSCVRAKLARSFDANFSFDRPATQSLPSAKARSVIDCCRGLRRSPGLATGALGSSTFENFMLSNGRRSILPAPSTRNSAADAPEPWPHITDT
jgi:hypothetical protein